MQALEVVMREAVHFHPQSICNLLESLEDTTLFVSGIRLCLRHERWVLAAPAQKELVGLCYSLQS